MSARDVQVYRYENVSSLLPRPLPFLFLSLNTPYLVPVCSPVSGARALQMTLPDYDWLHIIRQSDKEFMLGCNQCTRTLWQ